MTEQKFLKMSLDIYDIQENLWVSRLRGEFYVVEVHPFYIRNVNFRDIVIGKENNAGEVEFISVAARSPFATFRAFTLTPDFHETLISDFLSMETGYKFLSKKFVSVSAMGRQKGLNLFYLLEKYEKEGHIAFEGNLDDFNWNNIPYMENIDSYNDKVLAKIKGLGF